MRSRFRDWTIYDHICHLCISDRTALHAVSDPESFRAEFSHLVKRDVPRLDWKGVLIPGFGDYSGEELRLVWRRQAAKLASSLARRAPADRLPWFGPDMNPLSFATARLMETWAHGQTICDTLHVARPATPRLKHICRLGYKTINFNFMVRGLSIPTEDICVSLEGPGGERWQFGPENASQSVVGKAEEFCQVVCQCRNIADTALDVRGSWASEWMSIAQCFVGGASDPPAPGLRTQDFRKQE